MVIDGQYKEEMKQALLVLLKEGLTLDLNMSASWNEDGSLISVTTLAEVKFYGETITESECSTRDM